MLKFLLGTNFCDFQAARHKVGRGNLDFRHSLTLLWFRMNATLKVTIQGLTVVCETKPNETKPDFKRSLQE